jgi:ketopantoate reductase PanE/ApbA-like protein
MRIAVMAAGAVGGYFGARLAQAGHEVAFVARGRQLEALRARGLRVQSPLGDVHLPDVRVTDDPAEIGAVDLVLFGVKLWDTLEATEASRPLLGASTAVVSFQNGVVKDDILRQTLGAEHVIGGVCYIAATIAEPGLIRHSGTMAKLVFGEYDGSLSPRVRQFREACADSGIDTEISDHIEQAIWEKFHRPSASDDDIFDAPRPGKWEPPRSSLAQRRCGRARRPSGRADAMQPGDLRHPVHLQRRAPGRERQMSVGQTGYPIYKAHGHRRPTCANTVSNSGDPVLYG